MSKEKIVIYGCGDFFERNIEFIFDCFQVIGIIDKYKTGHKYGKKIVYPKDIKKIFGNTRVMITIFDIRESIDIATMLQIECGIDYRNILFGFNILEHGNIKDRYNAKVIPIENCLYHINIDRAQLDISSGVEWRNIVGTFWREEYGFIVNNEKRNIIIDVGLNVGDSALYFLQREDVEKVYGYEPFKNTYNIAKHNLEKYSNSENYEINQIGLSDVNETRKVFYNNMISDGLSTDIEVSNKIVQDYIKEERVCESDIDQEEIDVIRSSEIIKEIIDRHTNNNIVLKMDCEGEEYRIVRDLHDKNVLKLIDIVMLEWHYGGKEELLELLYKDGFSCWYNNKKSDMGLLFAYKMKSN